ncbi:hypothetical protein C9I56_37635 [Paraburkholderia caribensis]|uniref:Uncharacterized protein n=1 Tax=Paraburkholderia caribensis TaxID=75105 RepID=A0A9Q6RZ94_9BURK|nr:hypothetical protein C9I56_37635 [Paraburkholderia caribensis]QLB61629.1 hypothetical protein A9O66_04050 [Paraburkholderia caribensis]
MQNPKLLHGLLDDLELIDAATEAKDAFVERWRRLRPQESYPCPICFTRGEEQPLAVLSGQMARYACPACRTLYALPLEM